MSRPFDEPIPSIPRSPFPISSLKSFNIINGFGRGSTELGIPTANIDITELSNEINELKLGVYFGYAKLTPLKSQCDTIELRKDGESVEYNYGKLLTEDELKVLPIVLSVGLNPFYNKDDDNKNSKTFEIHIIHKFGNTFYGCLINFNILGYIRPELDYTTKEALINDINIDINIAKRVLNTDEYKKYKKDLEERE